jgi:tRNA threonylcarbamoyladenosine modification (KEOPS) complex  Pcc1 subunit
LQAELILEYDDPKVAEAIARAVSPDNFKTPKGLSIRTVRRANKVVTKLDCDGKFSTFIATIDDLLFSVSTAEKVLCTADNIR